MLVNNNSTFNIEPHLAYHHPPTNPADGAIISVVDSKNVYSGVPKDYTGAVIFLLF